MNKHQQFINALALIAKSQEPVSQSQCAAMIVYKNQIISIGKNSKKSHPLQAKFSRTPEHIFLHAEISALLKAIRILDHKELQKSTMYITRVLKDGSLAIARPCPGCQKALNQFKLKQVVWSTKYGYELSKIEDLNETNELYDFKKSERNLAENKN